MNHFIYAMSSKDPAPAGGGDIKSWFEYYKWDVGGFAFVPVKEELVDGIVPNTPTTVWFVMDACIIGCAPVHSMMPSLSGNTELHYDTRLMQVPAEHPTLECKLPTGMVGDRDLFDVLKRSMDAQYPPRDQALAAELGLVQSN